MSKARHTRCYNCDGKFGLIRHRRMGHHFCCRQCVENYLAVQHRELADLKRWMSYLARNSS